MSTTTLNGNGTRKSNGGFFSNMANPVIRKMEKNAVFEANANVATYGGVAGKTIFFLIVTIIGVGAYLVLHNIMLARGGNLIHLTGDGKQIYDLTISGIEILVVALALLISVITPFLAWFIRATIPVTGTIYCVAQGVVVGFIATALREDLKWIAFLAAVLTIALVGVMLFVYAKRIIKVTARFRGIIFALFGTIVIGGIIIFILNLIPATRNMIAGFNRILQSPALSIIFSIIFIIIAALFMLADFDTIERCVKGRMEKKYEWMAAWGLAYTILYVYFKILRLLIMIFGNAKSSSNSSSGSSF